MAPAPMSASPPTTAPAIAPASAEPPLLDGADDEGVLAGAVNAPLDVGWLLPVASGPTQTNHHYHFEC